MTEPEAAELTGYGDSTPASLTGSDTGSPITSPLRVQKARFQPRAANSAATARDERQTAATLEAQLEVALDETEVWRQKFRALDKRLAKLQEETDALTVENEALKFSSAQSQRSHSLAEKDKANLHAQIDTLTRAAAAAKDACTDAERALARQATSASQTAADLRAQLEAKERQLVEALSQRDNAERRREEEGRASELVVQELKQELDAVREQSAEQKEVMSPHPTLRLQRSISALSVRPSMESLNAARSALSDTESLIQQLTEQNKTLQDQIEALRNADAMVLEEEPYPSPPSASAMAVAPVLLPQRRAQAPGSPNFPRRTSSVRELLAVRTEGSLSPVGSRGSSPRSLRRSRTVAGGGGIPAQGGSLHEELNGSSAKYLSQIQDLKAENEALISYLVATLESLNKGKVS
ncbi:hypothetical protein HDU87_005401 [Geranomyces variabilis]|uniref:Uncharacterized protein n=1 Tax=Geranomyces variabilis TaxID=109894 RepID=A0AAD5TMB2_9FUNG|nr:hypothetical protein HDU87_005401 [Geranomyces variabilis]